MGGKAKSNSEPTMLVDPRLIRFMHARIRPVFSDGKLVKQTLQDIIDRKLRPEDLPLCVVIRQDDTHYYSMNNRRMWVLKQCRELGLLKDNQVLVRVRPMPESKKEREKYSEARCSLTAAFMREKPAKPAKDGAAPSTAGTEPAAKDGGSGSESEADEDDDC